jgi:hypothetical protein
MELIAQLHAPTALPEGKELLYPLDRMWSRTYGFQLASELYRLRGLPAKLVATFAGIGMFSEQPIPTADNLCFLDWNRYFSFK